MKIKPRHLAAAQYSILAIYFWASWLVLLLPLERTIGQLRFIFAASYENRTFFVFYGLSAIAVVVLAIVFWLPCAGIKPLAAFLAGVAFTFFFIAIWLFDPSLIIGFGLGSACALWSFFIPSQSFKHMD